MSQAHPPSPRPPWARPHPDPAPFQNCTYYWGFAAWMAYYINHPLYTPPSKWLWDPAPPVRPYPPPGSSQASPLAFFSAYGAQQVKLALAIFVVSRQAGMCDGVEGVWGALG